MFLSKITQLITKLFSYLVDVIITKRVELGASGFHVLTVSYFLYIRNDIYLNRVNRIHIYIC